MAEFVKDLSLGWSLASGVAESDQRSNSVHFDQRLVHQGSGVVVVNQGANARFYGVDGSYPLSDIWEIDVLDSGTLRVQTPYHMQAGTVWVLDGSGNEVLTHQPSKYTRRDFSETVATIATSGTHYMYQELKGRRSCEYRTLIQIDGSELGNSFQDEAPYSAPEGRSLPTPPPATPGAGADFYRLPLVDGEVLEIIDAAANFTNYNTSDAATLAADGQVATADPEGTAAYYYGNSGTGSEKINWYYYAAPGAPGAPVAEYNYGDVSQVVWLVRPDGSEGPFLTTYSVPQGDGNDAASWYRSRWNWSLNPGSYTPGQWYLAYRGTAPSASILPDVPRLALQFDAFSSAGPQADDEGVLYQVISTNSAAAAGAASAAHAFVGIDKGGSKDIFTFLLTGE